MRVEPNSASWENRGQPWRRKIRTPCISADIFNLWSKMRSMEIIINSFFGDAQTNIGYKTHSRSHAELNEEFVEEIARRAHYRQLDTTKEVSTGMAQIQIYFSRRIYRGDWKIIKTHPKSRTTGAYDPMIIKDLSKIRAGRGKIYPTTMSSPPGLLQRISSITPFFIWQMRLLQRLCLRRSLFQLWQSCGNP